jgi:carboxylesterase type B
MEHAAAGDGFQASVRAAVQLYAVPPSGVFLINPVDPKSTQDFVKKIFNNPGGPPPAESEDCLYLNVFAPSMAPPSDGWPVMFWIYGGSLQFGDAGISFYDGATLAAHENVVVVTTNYRTNVFGYPNSPEIS